jgi:hypothetical protein
MANNSEPYTRNVVLETEDREIVLRSARKLGFGGKGFSAALRFILRDWARNNDPAYRLTEQGRTALEETKKGEG